MRVSKLDGPLCFVRPKHGLFSYYPALKHEGVGVNNGRAAVGVSMKRRDPSSAAAGQPAMTPMEFQVGVHDTAHVQRCGSFSPALCWCVCVTASEAAAATKAVAASITHHGIQLIRGAVVR